MSFLSSLKKLFFTTESVAKSAVDKAVDYTKEKAGDLVEVAKETATDIGEKTSGLREAVIEKANVAIEKVEEVTEKVVEKASDVAETAWEKTKDVAENVAEATSKVVDKVEDIAESSWEKAKDVASDAGSKTAYAVTKGSEMADVSMTKPVEDLTDTSDFVESSHSKVADSANVESETIGDKISGLFEKTKEAASEAVDHISDSDIVKKAGAIAENVGSKVMETGAVAMDKAAQISENVGAKVLDASDQAWDKIGTVKEALAEKAKEVAGDLSQKFDDTVKKAETFLAEEDAKPKKDFADQTLTTGPDLLAGKDDFFAKASQYADGNYDAFSEGKITVTEQNKSDKQPSKTAGQEDHDGDGNDLIDDAIIVE